MQKEKNLTMMNLLIMVLFFSFTVILSPNSIFASNIGGAAEEEGLEFLLFENIPMVTSIGFFEVDSKKAPGYSIALSMDSMAYGPERTLSDILDMNILGITMGRHTRNGALIGTRGVMTDNSAKTLVMLDEQQLNERQHFGYMSGALSPFLGDIQKVEVILGPGAIVHGSGAINGFVNLISKNGKDNPGLNTNVEYGFKDKFKMLEVGYGKSYGEDKDFYIYAGILDADGFKPSNKYDLPELDWNANGYYDSNYRISGYLTHGNFKGHVYFENLNYDFNSYSHYLPDGAYYMHSQLGSQLKYTHNINENAWIDFTTALEWTDQAGRGNNGGNSTIDVQGGSENHAEEKITYKTKSIKNHQLAVGTLYGVRHFYRTDRYFSDDADSNYEADNGSWYESSIFAEDVITFSDKLTTSVGLRYDQVDYKDMYGTDKETDLFPASNSSESHVSPRIAAAYEIDKSTVFKLSYQQGFRYPDASYYHWHSFYSKMAEGFGYQGLPALVPETMDSYEANLHKDFDDIKLGADLNFFYNEYEDQLSWHFYNAGEPYLADGAVAAILAANGWCGSFINLADKMTSYGGEVNLRWQAVDNLFLHTGIGYVKTKDFIEKRYPQYQFKTGITSSYIENKLKLNLNHIYYSKLDDDAFPGISPIYENPRSVVNLSIDYLLNSEATIILKMQNVFEEDTPPLTYELNDPRMSNAGSDESLIYLLLNYKI